MFKNTSPCSLPLPPLRLMPAIQRSERRCWRVAHFCNMFTFGAEKPERQICSCCHVRAPSAAFRCAVSL